MKICPWSANDAASDDEARRLFRGHEVARRLRVGQQHGAAALDLAQEERHDAAAASHHVAEAHGRERRAAVVADGGDQQLADALRRAVDVVRVHRLIRRDEHDLRCAGVARRRADVERAGDVDAQRGVRVLLHDGDVLVRGRVERRRPAAPAGTPYPPVRGRRCCRARC